MRKWFKRIVKCTLVISALLLAILIGFCAYLYFTIDMKQPEVAGIVIPEQKLVWEDDFRSWGNECFLRRNSRGLWELKVEGDDYMRGVSIGKVSKDLLHFQENVFIDQIRNIIPSDAYLKMLGLFTLFFNRNLGECIDEEFRKEIYGISQSCTDEFDNFASPYIRQLNYHAAHDLGHAMQDYMLVGCSSFAVWGSMSKDSSLIVGRNFDFYVGEEFAKNKQVQFYVPTSGYKFVSVAWPAMTGVLSGMNEKGLTVTINAAKSSVPTSAQTPISIVTREILQYAATIDEAYKIAQQRETFVSESILIGSAMDGKAAIIEKSPHAIALFETDNESLICTNHFQSPIFADDERNIENIRSSDSPYRYKRMEQLIDSNKPLTPEKSARIMRDYKGIDDKSIGLTNEKALNQFIAHHSVVFEPQKGLIWVSTSPWQMGEYICYDLNKVFSDSIDFRQEIVSEELTIQADEMLHSESYTNLIAYKKNTKWIKSCINEKKTLSEDEIKQYIALNPDFYYPYELIGDYYNIQKNKKNAAFYWKKALEKEIPKLAESERIEKKISKLNHE